MMGVYLRYTYTHTLSLPAPGQVYDDVKCLPPVPVQVSVSLLQVFSQWQQGALQQLKHTINSLTQKTSQRAKVTAPATQSDDDSDDETQVRLRSCVLVPDVCKQTVDGAETDCELFNTPASSVASSSVSGLVGGHDSL